MMEDASYFRPKIKTDKTLIDVAVCIKLFSQSKKLEFSFFLQTFDPNTISSNCTFIRTEVCLCAIFMYDHGTWHIKLKPKKVKYTTMYPKLWVT